MPTNLDRIQTLLQPADYAAVRTLANHNRRALSAMSAELVREALKSPKYQQQLQNALVQVPERRDPRTTIQQIKTMRTPREASPNEKRWVNEVVARAHQETQANWWEVS